MDKFAENAFKEAMEQQIEQEFQSWTNFSEKDFMAAHMAVVARIGLEKINTLCGAVIKAGAADTLAEYAHSLMMMAFHIGYKARWEEEGCQNR